MRNTIKKAGRNVSHSGTYIFSGYRVKLEIIGPGVAIDHLAEGAVILPVVFETITLLVNNTGVDITAGSDVH